ncbi:MAG: ATP-binding protein [Lachnospiraceae bacterium]|nr:ATP-binding protein [Lachnospiraceae bacterium]
MSGVNSQRGFIYQSIVAIIECFDKDDWNEVKIEPNTEADKVDIMFYESGKTKRAIQVKSSINSFEQPSVERVLRAVEEDAGEASEVIVYLVGDSFTLPCEEYIKKKSDKIKTVSYSKIKNECLEKLIEYAKKTGLDDDIRLSDLELIEASIFAKIHINSIDTHPLSRLEFENAFCKAISVHKIPKILTNYLPPMPAAGLIGRDEAIKDVQNAINNFNSPIMIRGLGGIGKTALMRQIFEDIVNDGDDKNHVAWVTCSGNLKSDLLLLRDSLNVPKTYASDDALAEVINRLRSDCDNVYLFFDDLKSWFRNEELGIINSLRPTVRAIITSRYEIPYTPSISLGVLNKDSAIDLFYSFYKRDPERNYCLDATMIIDSDSVRRHTLLIELLAKAADVAFGNLHSFRLNLEAKGFFEVSQVTIDSGKFEDMTIEDSIIKLYDLSDLNDEKQKTMKFFSIFTPEMVILDCFAEWAGLKENEVNNLVKLGWLTRVERGFIIHQIIKDSLERQISTNGESVAIEEYSDLILCINDALGDYNGNQEITVRSDFLYATSDIVRCLEKRIQKKIVNKSLSETKDFLISISSIYNNIGLANYYIGGYTEALNYFKKALSIRKAYLESDSISFIKLYNNIAMVLQEVGDYTLAMKYLELARPICESKLVPNSIELATYYNNMYLVMIQKSNSKKAIKYAKKAKSIFESILGPEHIRVLMSYCHIGQALYDQKRYDEALSYLNIAREGVEKYADEAPFELATIYNAIAVIFSDKKEEEDANKYFGEALEIFKKVVGDNHPATANVYGNIAWMYYEMGKYEKALDFSELEFRSYNAKFGPNHFKTMAAKKMLDDIRAHLEPK